MPVAVVPLSVNNVASVYFGIRYNCLCSIRELPLLPFTTLFNVIELEPLAPVIVVVPVSKLVPIILLPLTSPWLISTNLLPVLEIFPPPAYDVGFTKSNTLTPTPFLLKYPVDEFLLKPLELASPNALSFPVTVVKDGCPWVFFGVAVIVFKTSFVCKATPLVASNL